MEGASGRSEPQPLTGRRGRSVLVAGGAPIRRGARRDKRCQRSMRTLRPRKTTPRNGGRPFEGSPISEPTRVSGAPDNRRIGGDRERNSTEARGAPSSATRPGMPSGVRPGWIGRRESGRPRPGIERSLQVHVTESRLQKSVTSTFLVHGRGHRKMSTGLRGSVRRSSRVVGRRREPIAARESVPEGGPRTDTFA